MTLLPLFDTPVFVFEVPGMDALNAELVRALVAERHASPGIHVSNRGGWHSIPDLARRPDPLFRELSAMLVAHFRLATEHIAARHGHDPMPSFGLALTAWAMVMQDGDYTVLHDHPAATWSSAYYADPGDADEAAHPESGVLTLVDPRRASGGVIGLELFPSTFRLRPAAGTLVVFPGWLQHYVHPYRGARPRVMVAANATIRVEDPGRPV